MDCVGSHVTVSIASVALHWAILLALARLGMISSSLPQTGERSQNELLNVLNPDLIVSDQALQLGEHHVLHLSSEWLQQTFAKQASPLKPHRFASDDVVRIVLSSGTTGTPKKMAFTRRMVDERIKTGAISKMGHRALHSVVGLDSETGFRAPLVAWATGSPVLYPEAGYDWPKFLTQSQPEVIVLVPAQLEQILTSLPADFPVRSDLTLIIVSGALPPSLYARAQACLTPEIYVTYGSTEAGLACQLSPQLKRTDGVVSGIISPSADVEVVDPSGQSLPPGSPGAIRVRTEEMVKGYLDNHELTANSFKEDWFYPGDLGFLDDAGRLTILGRESEVMDLGGVRLAPEVIENLLLDLPTVRDAAAFSVPGAEGLHTACAVVVVAPGFRVQEAQSVLSQALPQISVKLREVDTIARSERGKIMRKALVEAMTSVFES